MSVIVMDNLKQLLVAIAALTLLFSVVSGANPNYFVDFSAFADEGEEDDDNDNSGDYEGESDGSEYTVHATFGENSWVGLDVDDEVEDDEENSGSVEAELEIETDGGDLPDGEHTVALTCTTPELNNEFEDSLEVEDGKGEFKGELLLSNATGYDGCQVAIGDMVVDLPAFAVAAGSDDDDDDKEEREANRGNGRGDDDDEEEDDDSEAEDDDENGREREHERSIRSDDDGVEIKIEADVNMTDGTYDAKFTCDDPVIDMTIEDSLEVEDGEAEFEAELDLAIGTYSGCEITSGDTTIASLDAFTVAAEEEDDSSVEEKRREKRRDLVSNYDAEGEHKRRVNANPASTGDYDPNWNYTLIAGGLAVPHEDDDELAESSTNSSSSNATSADLSEQFAEVAIDMSVWKSNRAVILLNLLNGTVDVGGELYSVELGYALYSTQHDVMRIGAFVSDESGNIYKLKLRGSAVGEDAEFPDASGESIEMIFEGNSGPARNSIGGYELELEGAVEAN